MSSKENQLLLLDDDLRNLITFALVKYQKEIEEKIIAQRSQLRRAALFMERRGQIQRALRRLDPINKNQLPSLVNKNRQGKGEY